MAFRAIHPSDGRLLYRREVSYRRFWIASSIAIAGACGAKRGASTSLPEHAAAEAPVADSPIAVTFASASAVASCTITVRADATLADDRGSHTMVATAESSLALQLASTGELGLGLSKLSTRMTFDGRETSAFTIDGDGIETRHLQTIEHKRVADDPATRRSVEFALGAPHLFLRFDERARVSDRRVAVPAGFEQLAELTDQWNTWLFSMPVLPADATRAGGCWTGTRPLAVAATVKPPPEIELRYCLASIDDARLVVTAQGSGGGRHAWDRGTADVSWRITGKATLAREGARLTTSAMRGEVEVDFVDGPPVTWHFESEVSCAPPQ